MDLRDLPEGTTVIVEPDRMEARAVLENGEIYVFPLEKIHGNGWRILALTESAPGVTRTGLVVRGAP